jgi:hypothetical protein
VKKIENVLEQHFAIARVLPDVAPHLNSSALLTTASLIQLCARRGELVEGLAYLLLTLFSRNQSTAYGK